MKVGDAFTVFEFDIVNAQESSFSSVQAQDPLSFLIVPEYVLFTCFLRFLQ